MEKIININKTVNNFKNKLIKFCDDSDCTSVKIERLNKNASEQSWGVIIDNVYDDFEVMDAFKWLKSIHEFKVKLITNGCDMNEKLKQILLKHFF